MNLTVNYTAKRLNIFMFMSILQTLRVCLLENESTKDKNRNIKKETEKVKSSI